MRAGAAIFGLVMTAATAARAQNPPIEVDQGYSVERFRLATDSAGILDVESAEVGEPMRVELGMWLGYADDPLNVYQEGEVERERIGSLVSHRLGGDLIGSVSLGRLQIALDVPLILSQDEDAGAVMTAGPGISSFGLGDVRVVPKLQVLAPPRLRPGVGVAVALGGTIPTGTEDNYFGDDGGTLTPELILAGRIDRRARLGLNLGYRVRRESRALDLEINDEIYAHLGGAYRINDAVELMATWAVATAAARPFASSDEIYSEVHGGASLSFGRGSLFAAVGTGTTGGIGAPDWRVVSGLRLDMGTARRRPRPLVPEPHLLLTVKLPPTVGDPDSDLDGKLDSLDDCPGVPEDPDGFEDSDGCPDLDNDRDLVADADDACPLEPGPRSAAGCPVRDRDGDGVRDAVDNCPDQAGEPDNQGCAKKQLVVLSETEIALLQPVLFPTNQARVRLRSYPLLRNVAEVLKNHPDIQKIRIEGHTDSQGSAESNLDLSRRRAETVREFLIAQGVDGERLTAVGRGEDQPIADNRTAEGRAKNRRVDFAIAK